MDEKLLETESGLIGTETIGQKEEKIRYKWKESKELSKSPGHVMKQQECSRAVKLENRS